MSAPKQAYFQFQVRPYIENKMHPSGRRVSGVANFIFQVIVALSIVETGTLELCRSTVAVKVHFGARVFVL